MKTLQFINTNNRRKSPRSEKLYVHAIGAKKLPVAAKAQRKDQRLFALIA